MASIPGIHPATPKPTSEVSPAPAASEALRTVIRLSPVVAVGFSPPASGSTESAASPKTSAAAPAASTRDQSIDRVIAAWVQSEVHGSEISQYTPALNRLKAILPKLAASLKGIK